MRGVFVAALAAFFVLACAGVASAKKQPPTVTYGASAADAATIYPAGSTPVILLHERGKSASSIKGVAKYLQEQGLTVFALDWEEPRGEGGIFPFDTKQVEEGIAYVGAHAAQWKVNPGKLAIVGGSRGALLAMVIGERANDSAPGTVKVVVSLSGAANPKRSIERARNGEGAKKELGALDSAYGCSPRSCDEAYVSEWSPVDHVDANAPAMYLVASEFEHRAWPVDQTQLANELQAVGVAATVNTPSVGHAFAMWAKVRTPAIAFINAHT
jgi:acetyl esterase/lipase